MSGESEGSSVHDSEGISDCSGSIREVFVAAVVWKEVVKERGRHLIELWAIA